MTTLKEFAACSDGKKASKRVRVDEAGPSQRHCGRCGDAGHNLRTCKKDVEIVSD